MSRSYTRDEIQNMFLNHIENSTAYWDKVEPDKKKALEGLAFSIMVVLDGGCMGIPGFAVMPAPHPDDRAYHEEQGENWFPDDEDIGGALHEQIFKRRVPSTEGAV